MEPRDLYGLPLERFTEERDALARRLRKDGQRDQAATVSKLRKPSLAAWAVNQVVRTQRRDLDALFEAGDALQKAQAELIKGRGDAARLRQAVEAERALTEHLVERAQGLLSSDGHALAAAKLEQVSETLHAAALDNDARARVQDGCLERELRHVGLGALVATGPAPRSAPRAPARANEPRPTPDRKAARQAEAEARRRMERAARALSVAQDRRDRAADQLRAADEQLDRAREQAEEATAAHQRAERALEGH